MTRSLVIGGAGFIGGHLARALAADGEQVDILDNFSRGVRDAFLEDVQRMPGVRLITGDLLGADPPEGIARDYDTIYQFAAIIGVRHVLERPYEVLTKNVAIHARAIDIAREQSRLNRFVFASTSEIYAGSLLHLNLPVPTPENVPLALTDLAQPRTSYMLSKLYGEAMCHHSGLPFTIIRPHNVYGPRMGLVHVLPELMLKARGTPPNGRLPVASVSHRRAFCFIDDAVDMIRGLVRSASANRGTFNIGNADQEIAIGDVAEMVTQAVGRSDIAIEPLPETPGSPSRRCPDMRATITASGVTPDITLRDGIGRTYEWYRAHVFEHSGASAI